MGDIFGMHVAVPAVSFVFRVRLDFQFVFAMADQKVKRPLFSKRLQASDLKGYRLLFYCKDMKSIAHEIAAINHRILLEEIEWNNFPDGFPNLLIKDAYKFKWAHAAFLASFHSQSVLFEQLSVIMTLPKLLVKSFKVILPYFPTGTMERVTTYGQVATANVLARLLSEIPQAARGPTQICIFDIHALGNQFYFTDNVIIRLHSCISLLLKEIKKSTDIKMDQLSIAFPDDGAFKRFGHRFNRFRVIVCEKRRDGDERRIRLKEGDPQGRHIIIVDDLVQSGGTILQCAMMLKKHGASKVCAYVTHAIFPNDAWKKFISTDVLHKFYVTDTNPTTVRHLKGVPPFEILSISDRVSELITDSQLITS